MRPNRVGADARSLQADCATFATVSTVVAVIMTLGLVVNVAAPVLRRLAAPEPTLAAMTLVGLTAFVSVLANLFLADALWKAPRLFGRMAEGALLDPAHGKDARAAGTSLMAGGVVAQTVTPALLARFGDLRWQVMDFSLEWMAVVGLVVAIWLIGRVLDVAAAVQAENEAIV